MSYVLLILWIAAMVGAALFFIPDIKCFYRSGDKYAAEVGALAFAAVAILLTGMGALGYMVDEQRHYYEEQDRTNVLNRPRTGRGE